MTVADRAAVDERGATSSRAAVLADVTLGLTVLGSVLALGSVQVPVLVAIAGLSAVAAHVAREAVPRAGGTEAVQVVLGLLALWTLLSVVPLPMPVLSAIAPSNADVWRRAADVASEGTPSWAPISVDPGASMVEVLKLLTYANVFAAAGSAGRRWGTRRIALCVLGAGAIVALVTLAHGTAGATTVFGIYRPTIGIGPWHMGPLLNANNLAGYMNVAALSGLGLMMLRTRRLDRAAIGFGVVVVLAVAFIAASRAGYVALALGLVALPLLGRMSQRRARAAAFVPLGMRWLLVGAVLVVGGGLAVMLGTDASVREISDRDVSKLYAMRRMLPMIWDHFWVGMGRGAFESVSPAYGIGSDGVVFAHAENFVIQWASEWGVPMTLAAMAAFAWAVRPSALGLASRPPVAGIVAGVMALLVQNLADLALEVPGVVILVCLSLGGCLGAVGPRRRVWPWGARLAAPLATVLGMGAVVAWGTRTVGVDERELQALFDSAGEPGKLEQGTELARAAIRRHPAAPYFYRAAALFGWLSGDPTPLRFLGRALERWPESGRSHLLLGRMLAARGVEHQALLEARHAVLNDHRLARQAARIAVGITTDVQRLERVAPEGPAGTRVLVAMAREVPSDRDDVRERLLRAALERSPDDRDALDALARLLLDLVTRGASHCRGRGRVECQGELDALTTRLAEAGDTGLALVIRSEQALAKGEADRVERELADACFTLGSRGRCLRVRVRAAAATKDRKRLQAAVAALASDACPGRADCADTLGWIADAVSAAGYPAMALAYLERVAREKPSVAAWLRVARAARTANDRARAMRALREARAAPKGDADASREVERERRAWDSPPGE